jgi:hypothetical protein
MINTPRNYTVAFAAFASLLCSTASSSHPVEIRDWSVGQLVVRAASNDDGEVDPDDMEAALAQEQARQDAMEDFEKQVSAPLKNFTSFYDKALTERETAAHKAFDSIVKRDCNLSAVEALRGEFIASSVLKADKSEIDNARAALIEKGVSYKISYASPMPADPTGNALQGLNDTAAKIKAINTEYAASCVSAQEQMSKLPVTASAKMMEISSQLQSKQSSMSGQVAKLVESLNKDIDALDAGMVAWALQPLKTAKPK